MEEDKLYVCDRSLRLILENASCELFRLFVRQVPATSPFL